MLHGFLIPQEIGSMIKRYTCNDYRQEMILVGLKKQLADPELSPAQKARLQAQISKLETEMDLD
jgi:hypothetical protein